MPRKDEALLLDMLLASRKIIRFSQGLTRDTLDLDEHEMALSAIVRQFQIIGEASRMLSDDAKQKYQQIPWKSIIGLRNRVIHEYFNIDLDVLWATIQTSIPEFVEQLEAIVPTDDEDDPDSLNE